MKTDSKSTKKALITSVVAILTCVAMLIGTTFAWFTDTKKTGGNKVQSGTLSVDIVDKEGTGSLVNKELNFVNVDGSSDILWEPGATFKTPAFQIKSNGTLALKYKLSLNDVTGDTDLLKVIKFTVVNEEGTEIDLDTFEGHLTANSNLSGNLYIKGTMDEGAGNTYQGKTLTGLGITVVATQDTVERDSKDNTYDENATYPVIDAGELKTALVSGGVVTIPEDIETNNSGDTVDDRIIIKNPTTLNLEKKIISPNDMGNNNTNFCALIVDADTTINAGVDGGIDTGVNGGYGINVRNGATVTINGGTYYGGGTAVQVQKGTLIINDGHFACEPFGEPYGYNFLINCVDSAYKNGTAKVEIKGGTFVNFDPSNNTAEGAGTNFVADGYKVISETKDNGDTWYTVVAE